MRIAISTIALVACTSLASAADFGGPSYDGSLKDGPVLAQQSWSGLYVGGHVGYGWGDSDTLTIGRDRDGNVLEVGGGAPAIATNSYDSNGWLGGLQLGYNIQAGRWVIGIEGDYSWTDISGSFNFDPTRPEAIAGGDIDWLATVRGRVGYTFDSVLIYGTAGLAIAEFGGFANNFEDKAPASDRASGSSTETGWTVGGGLEIALSRNISVKGEYLYMQFDDASGKLISPAFGGQYALHVENDVSLHTVRVGLNYKFGH